MIRNYKYLGLFLKNKLIVNYISEINDGYVVRVRYDSLSKFWNEYYNSQQNRIFKNIDMVYENWYLIFDSKGNKVIASNSIRKLVKKLKNLVCQTLKMNILKVNKKIRLNKNFLNYYQGGFK